jgi:hypothetical protein
VWITGRIPRHVLGGLARYPTLPGFPYLLPQPRSRFRECAPNQQRIGFAHPEHEGHAVDEDHGGEALIYLTTSSKPPIRLSGPAEER